MLKIDEEDLWWTKPVEYEPVYQLGSNFMESIAMMKKVDELQKKFPGLDCGCCGAPSCKSLAEDIVRGVATENSCIHILKDRLHSMAEDAREFVNNTDITQYDVIDYVHKTKQYINKMSNDINELDNTIGVKNQPTRITPLQEDIEIEE
jgi:Na+-translocating ferredoxin:NAD+ oxidoreductase RNF subunit RnfB